MSPSLEGGGRISCIVGPRKSRNLKPSSFHNSIIGLLEIKLSVYQILLSIDFIGSQLTISHPANIANYPLTPSPAYEETQEALELLYHVLCGYSKQLLKP